MENMNRGRELGETYSFLFQQKFNDYTENV